MRALVTKTIPFPLRPPWPLWRKFWNITIFHISYLLDVAWFGHTFILLWITDLIAYILRGNSMAGTGKLSIPLFLPLSFKDYLPACQQVQAKSFMCPVIKKQREQNRATGITYIKTKPFCFGFQVAYVPPQIISSFNGGFRKVVPDWHPMGKDILIAEYPPCLNNRMGGIKCFSLVHSKRGSVQIMFL